MADQEKEMMSEEAILNGKFIFVSYNHSDADIVSNDVKKLHQKSVRVWTDVNMHATNDWTEIAKERIQNPNCVGVLFYNSISSFLSDACELERNMTWKRMESDPAFKYWFVNLNGPTKKMIGEASMRAQNESIDKLIAFSGYLANINEYFKETNIYIHPDEVCLKMVREAAEVGAIDDKEQTIKLLKQEGRISDERNIVELGVFMDKKYVAPIKHDKPYERFEANGQKFIAFNNEVYTVKPLHWDLIATKDGHAILLCDRIIALCEGGEKAQEYLKHFLEVAFTEKQKAAFDKPARLLSLKDLDYLGDKGIPSLSEKPFGDIHYWLDDQGLLDDWQMTAKDNAIYKKGFLITNKKGIRPIIEIPTDKLEEFKKEH